MLMLDNLDAVADPAASARAALIRALDMTALWQACAELVTRTLPCHSCSLMFDIDGYEPQQGRHVLARSADEALPVTSLTVSAPYLAANPRVRWYTFSQIASQDAAAAARLREQNPGSGWREFIHLAFWNDRHLEAVLSIRILADHPQLDQRELAFLADLYTILDASLQRVRSIESERIRHKAFEALLFRLPLATAVVDDRMRPLYLSPEARRLCARWSEGAQPRRLPLEIEGGLRGACTDAGMAPGEPRTLTLAHPSGGQRMRIDISAPLSLGTGRDHYILTFAQEQDAADATLDTSDARLLPLMQRLSPSERKVAGLVASGLRNDDIAAQLYRSRKTIESQISSIYRKLDIGNRAQLVRLLAG